MSVMSGLNNSSVQRLKEYWSSVSDKLINSFKKFETLMDNIENFKSYREQIKTIQSKPCIPYLAVHLRDVFFATDSNDTFINSPANKNDPTLKLINFDGLKITGNFLFLFLNLIFIHIYFFLFIYFYL